MPECERGERRSRVRVISHRLIREFCDAHPGDGAACSALDTWFKIVGRQSWSCFTDVQATFSHADEVIGRVVINVGGNTYRVVAEINDRQGYVFLKGVLTHKEYDRGDWRP